MDNIRIFYQWTFTLEVINKKKRRYRKHVESATATDYGNAKGLVCWQLGKKHLTLVEIKSARPLYIEFAYYGAPGYGLVDHSLYSSLPVPTVPDQL